jgi:hypothetical protein
VTPEARAARAAVARGLLDAVDKADWERARLLLHPYLHWTTADGHTLRGRTTVLARLRHAFPPGSPATVELRDDQIYRWTE